MTVLNDPRVEVCGDGFTVSRDNNVFRVLPNEVLGWGIYRGAKLELVVDGNGPAIGYNSAAEAISVVLGQ